MSINRREFITGLGLVSAGCAISSYSPGCLAVQPKSSLTGKTTLTASLCEMCSFRCPIQAQVINGKTVFIQGNANAPQQGTRICARGGSGVSLLNDPQRIVQPMKRVGPRGSGKWQVISWQTAYQEIAQRLQAIKQHYGAESVVFSSKAGSLASHLFHFAHSFGSPNTFTHATTCPAGKAIAAQVMMGGDLMMDLEHTDYMVAFGHNLYEGIEVADTHKMMAAQEKGAKLVSFDPRLSVLSSKADEWHAIRPGGDLPVLMAMCQVIISENLYDKAFVEQYTLGFEQFAQSVSKATPEWAQPLSDIPAADIRRIARELAAAAPHAIVNPGHRATFSKEEIDMRRTIFALNALLGNLERRGGLMKRKSAEFYNKLAGENVAPVLAKMVVKDMPAITAKRIDAYHPQFNYISKRGGIVQSIIDGVNRQYPYAVKGWIMSRHNPMQTIACRPDLEKTLNALELVVSCDVYLSESAAYADYLLPDTTYLERDEDIIDASTCQPAYAVRQQVVTPIGNTKPSWLIWQELATELGLGHYFPWPDMASRQLYQANGDEQFHQQLKQKGYLTYGIPLLLREPESVAQFIAHYPASQSKLSPEKQGTDNTFSEQLRFSSPSGKIELYSATLESIAPGYGSPTFRNLPLKKDHELFFIQGKVAVHTNGATHYVPMLAELMNNNPVWIHPDTAKAQGIKTGDTIQLTNSTGQESGQALVTPAIRPDTVFVYMGFGSKAGAKTADSSQGIHCGNLLPHEISPVCGTDVHTSGVQLTRVSGGRP